MTPTGAAGAYAAMAKAVTPQAETAKPFADTGGFADMLKASVAGLVETGQGADRAGMAAAAGQTNVVDVVTAVAETELALETLVSVRDKVIQAYEEIMRMPI